MQLVDCQIVEMAGPEPVFDDITHDFLCNSRDQLLARCRPGGLLEAVSLGRETPWLWRLTFATRGLVRDPHGEIRVADRHVVAVRFLPDYLRRANQFESMALMEPSNAFHPNLAPPRICLRIYPGQPLLEVCEGLHTLFSWRLYQLAENDALNPDACAWGRSHLAELPIDNRPLFGRSLQIHLEPMEEQP